MTFLGVGVASASVDAGMFSLLYALGVAAPAASAIGFLSAFAVNYSGNRALVFRVVHSRKMLIRYVLLVALNFVLSTSIVAGLVAVSLQAHVAKLISMAVIALINYWLMSRWVFGMSESSSPGNADPSSASAHLGAPGETIGPPD
ncbi:MAG: GtrA family protein [Propionibacteriaceae bacterium]